MRAGDHPLVEVVRGDFPVVLSVPHAGRMPVPGELAGYVAANVRADRDADLLAYEIRKEARKAGAFFSSVVARGRRALLDLNRGETETRGVPALREYYRAYMEAIEECLAAACERHGGAVLLDVHGYAESRHRARPEMGFTPGDIVFGTWNGDLVPPDLRPACEAFKSHLAGSGFPVHPGKGEEEYPRLIGGAIVRRFGGRRGVAAVQMEVPARIRFDPPARVELARAAAAGLIVFAAAVTP